MRISQRDTFLAIILALLIVYCTMLMGCANLGGVGTDATPLQKWAQASETYSAVQQSLAHAYDVNLITPQQDQIIVSARPLVESALNEMKVAALSGDKVSFEHWLRTFDKAIDELIKVRIQSGG